MKILVTGCAGFIGSHLCEALLNDGHTVYGIDNLSGGFKRNIYVDEFFECDIAHEDTVQLVKNIAPDVLFHLAADATEGRSQFTPVSATRNNLTGYMNVLTGAIAGGVKKVILASSMSVYGAQEPPFDETMPRMPQDVYAVNKTAMEQATEILSSVHGFRYTIIRPHNVFGERQNIADPYRNVVGIFMNRLLNDLPPIVYGDGEQTRSFSYIDNVIPSFVAAIDNADGEIVNIGPTQYFSISYLAHGVLEEFGSELLPVHYPERPLEVKHAFCTNDKAKRLLGYKTIVPFEEGVERMAKWAKELGKQKFRYLDSLEITNANTPKTWLNHEM